MLFVVDVVTFRCKMILKPPWKVQLDFDEFNTLIFNIIFVAMHNINVKQHCKIYSTTVKYLLVLPRSYFYDKKNHMVSFPNYFFTPAYFFFRSYLNFSIERILYWNMFILKRWKYKHWYRFYITMLSTTELWFEW